MWRAFADREARPARRRSWQILAVAAAACLIAAMALGRYWQGRIRALLEMPPGRTRITGRHARRRRARLRHPDRRRTGAATRLPLDREICSSRWIGPRAARATGWTAVVAGTALLISGVLLDGLVTAADAAFSVRNGTTEAGVTQPTARERSGGPGVAGLVGRRSVSKAAPSPGPARRRSTSRRSRGGVAPHPVRAYAGLESAPTAEDRARVAVDDLVRAGGFDRRTLVVVTTTGSGWVDPGAVDSVEYITGGDTATVSIQYSYLPSWLSYLVDQERAREAGRELFDAVYDRWSKLPVDRRPTLVVVGESLGSFGGETAFSGEYDLRNRTAGAVFAGPPNFNTLFASSSTGATPARQR